MNALNPVTRLLSLAASAVVSLAIFNAVLQMTDTLPDVKVARAAEAQRLAAVRAVTVATADEAATR